jgi:Na+-translocating ferredoxin:NAD+ oxidoreductase subunit B
VATRRALARMLGRDAGISNADNDGGAKRIAVIVEADCIGCTKCILVCPVDAIVGASGMMHTVVSNLCTGCDLCAPVCPTDCIEMHEPTVQFRGTPQTPPLAA